MKVYLSKEEYKEATWSTGLGLATVLGLDRILQDKMLQDFGSNAPDPLVAAWALTFGSVVYGTVAQYNTNGLKGVLGNLAAVSSYMLPLAVGTRKLTQEIRSSSSDFNDEELREMSLYIVGTSAVIGSIINVGVNYLTEESQI